jgi:Zn-dependent protease
MDIFEILQLAIILAISIGMHEYAHAYVSYRLGDPTPKLQGRLTPNPLKHLDPIGFVMIFIAHF